MPFLNSRRFLAEAVHSVLRQTFSSWELILVDDGSTDGSTELAHELAALDRARISCIEHPGHRNEGMSASRNLGVSMSRGQYIASLDSDDKWTEGKLESQIDIMRKSPSVVLTFGPMMAWRSWQARGLLGSDVLQSLTCRTDSVFEPPSFIPFLLSGRNDPQGVLMLKSAIEAVGAYENAIHMCEDWALYVKLALRYPIYVSGECHCWYRIHPNSYTRRISSRNSQTGMKVFFDWLTGYLDEHGVNDTTVRSALESAIRRNRLAPFYRVMSLPRRAYHRLFRSRAG